jgi:class 3 adenylate cyclase/tetratricopeptide (TPR) repeat protein
MSACPTCGAPVPSGARFCPACGTALRLPHRLEERRTVTILFVDLVGFTERSDRADPEDVRRTLVPFHSSVKDDLEHFGGTLDKFIGDAVMGVFGAPIAHEDDPVRAVRAGLQILRSIETLRRNDPELAVRVAVNTGEAVVAFGTGPQVGEAVAGDVVNTASRMQSLAPRNSLVVGETTLRALRDRFEVEPLPPAMVKGKAEPLRVWRVEAERAAADLAPSAFVGREHELTELTGIFDRAAAAGSIQTVTVVGDAGLGKSRLVRELQHRLAGRARELSGTCPPYGEGVTFAPIAETVRALGGIGPSDEPDVVRVQLHALAARVDDDPAEQRWLAARLGSALGIGGSDHDTAVEPGEMANAWANVLALAASERALLLIIEDLHWAEPTLLQILEAMQERLRDRAVLIVATARPALAELDGGWLAPRAATTTIHLAPLATMDTERLLASLLERGASTAKPTEQLVERVGGNPLYALEFARMIGDRIAGAVEDNATPESVQAVIAARLDGIPAELRALVIDASVIGDEFWVEALASIGGRGEPAAKEGVEALVRRGIAEPRPSALAGLPGYGFTHSLIREVAYGRLPRGQRARRHLAAAEWLEGAAGTRVEERAEILARQYASAAELGEAAGEREIADRALGPAFRWLMAAGDRARLIDAGRAFSLFDRALGLVPQRTTERLQALGRSAMTGRQSDRLDAPAVLARYEEALAIAGELGEPEAVGEALIRVGSQLGAIGETPRARDAFAEAVRVLETLPPGRALGRAYAYRAEEELFAGRSDRALELADQALQLLGPEDEYVIVMALHIRGDARCSAGDEGGLDDLWEALRISEEANDASATTISHTYIGPWLLAMEGPRRAIPEFEAGLGVAERRGIVSQTYWCKSGLADSLYEVGGWDEALVLLAEVLDAAEHADAALIVKSHVTRNRILLARGRRAEATDPEEVLRVARRVEEVQVFVPSLSVAAAVAASEGRPDDAIEHLEEFERVTRDVSPEYRASELADAVRICIRVGDLTLAETIVAGSTCRVLRERLQLASARAAIAEARGTDEAAADYRTLAEEWRTYGHMFEEALALAGLIRCLEQKGRDSETGSDRARAETLFASLGVPPSSVLSGTSSA